MNTLHASPKMKLADSAVSIIVRDVLSLTHKYGVDLEDIVPSLGIDLKTFTRWESHVSSHPRSISLVKERLEKIKLFFREAEKAISPKFLPTWLNTPDPRLLGFPPVKCLSTFEGYEKVLKIVTAYRWGMP